MMMREKEKPMCDVVERLQAWSQLVASGLQVPAAAAAMDEASAEIQRLRARVEQLEREMRYIGRLDYPTTRMSARDRARAALTP
jgi:outer membrane murein-binding lipoprotein Lpp